MPQVWGEGAHAAPPGPPVGTGLRCSTYRHIEPGEDKKTKEPKRNPCNWCQMLADCQRNRLERPLVAHNDVTERLKREKGRLGSARLASPRLGSARLASLSSLPVE